MSRDVVDDLNWRFNYEDDNQWIPAVVDYIQHLEGLLHTLEGEMELAAVEPKEYPAEVILDSCWSILKNKQYKASFKDCASDVEIDLEKRLSEVVL